MWLEAPDEPRLDKARLDELAAADVDLCVTACPYCRTMIADGASEADGADRAGHPLPAVRDLVELLAQARPDTVASDAVAAEHTPAHTAARDQE